MTPLDALVWVIVAALSIVVAFALFLILWFVVDVVRGKR